MPTLVKAEQRSPEWYGARLGKATASRFNDIISRTKSGYSASHKNYAAELMVEILTGEPTPSFTSTAMQWGIDYEPVARLQYELATGNDVDETGFWFHNHINAGASPDGLVRDDGLVEIKCPNTATHLDTLVRKKVPKQYIAQVQGQLWITGRKWCDFVSYDPRLPANAQLLIVHVERDDKYIKELEEEVKNFGQEVSDLVEFVKNFH